MHLPLMQHSCLASVHTQAVGNEAELGTPGHVLQQLSHQSAAGWYPFADHPPFMTLFMQLFTKQASADSVRIGITFQLLFVDSPAEAQRH